MNEKAMYPRRPVRATVISFLALSLLVAASMLFVEPVRRAWPLAIAYCAALSVATIGLMRHSPHVVPRIHALSNSLVALCVLGILASFRWPAMRHWLGPCLNAVPYVVYAFVAWICYLAIRGWMLYFQPPDEEK